MNRYVKETEDQIQITIKLNVKGSVERRKVLETYTYRTVLLHTCLAIPAFQIYRILYKASWVDHKNVALTDPILIRRLKMIVISRTALYGFLYLSLGEFVNNLIYEKRMMRLLSENYSDNYHEVKKYLPRKLSDKLSVEYIKE